MQTPYRNHWFQMHYDETIELMENPDDLYTDNINSYIDPVQSTALLYEENQDCQEEKQMGHKNKQEAYEQGAKDVYYGRPSDVKNCLTAEQMDAYWNGYAAEPYGRKDYGYDED